MLALSSGTTMRNDNDFISHSGSGQNTVKLTKTEIIHDNL